MGKEEAMNELPLETLFRYVAYLAAAAAILSIADSIWSMLKKGGKG
jgi:hypothetical protein